MHIVRPGETEIQYLRDHFEFHPLDLEDCVNIAQRPKVDAYDKYIFLVLLFPHYQRSTRSILPAEVDFFIGPNYLISVSDGKHELIDHFFDDCLKSEVYRERFLSQSPAHLLYEILHRFQDSMFPMLDHMSEDIGVVESQIFNGVEQRMVRDILLVKRNIVNFRRIVNAHKSTIRKLMDIRRQGVFALSSDLSLYFSNSIDRSKDVWEILEIHKETINAFQETNDSLISFKLNDVMRVLTAISVSLLPATLLVSIFGMNTTDTPVVSSPYGFWIIMVLIVILVVTILNYFKKKGWLQ